MSQPLEVVENALAAMLERRRDQIIKNPAGFLVKAIKNQWKPREKKPTQAAATERSKLPDGFLEWYQWAIAHGIVEDVPVSWLPLYQNHEPMVRVSQPSIGGAPYTLMRFSEAKAQFGDWR
jgi:hypothetical protein